MDYLTDSIITGLGRKSLLILDNLGLSAAEVNEEMAKTGDLMAAVAAIVDRQLAQAGENYVSAADKAAQKAAELQNRQMEIGRLLLPLQEKWSGLFQSLKLGFSDVALRVLEHKKSIITLISVVTGFILVYKTVILLQKTWNGLLMLGKAVSPAYASVVAMQRGNILRSAAAMKMYNASVASNNILVKACTASTYLFAAAKAVLTGEYQQGPDCHAGLLCNHQNKPAGHSGYRGRRPDIQAGVLSQGTYGDGKSGAEPAPGAGAGRRHRSHRNPGTEYPPGNRTQRENKQGAADGGHKKAQRLK
ncbi:hypothetical protein NXY01_15100 [Bacteroides fragilis]|nr:hypothetical protein NXY01_15100 [Bacteroides fragilis]